MTAVLYRPFKEFQGFVGNHQNNIEDVLDISSSSVFQNHSVNAPISAFNYSSSYPAATDRDGKYSIFFSLKSTYFFITHYQLQQRDDEYRSNFLDHWSFEGSIDDDHWYVLDSTKADQSFMKNGAILLIRTKNKATKHFRLRNLVKDLIVVNKIEIYGVLCDSLAHCSFSCLRSLKVKFSTIHFSPLLVIAFLG